MSKGLVIGLIVAILIIVIILVLVLVVYKKKYAPPSYQIYRSFPALAVANGSSDGLYKLQWNVNALTPIKIDITNPLQLNQVGLVKFTDTQKFTMAEGNTVMYPNPGSLDQPITFTSSKTDWYFKLALAPNTTTGDAPDSFYFELTNGTAIFSVDIVAGTPAKLVARTATRFPPISLLAEAKVAAPKIPYDLTEWFSARELGIQGMSTSTIPPIPVPPKFYKFNLMTAEVDPVFWVDYTPPSTFLKLTNFLPTKKLGLLRDDNTTVTNQWYLMDQNAQTYYSFTIQTAKDTILVLTPTITKPISYITLEEKITGIFYIAFIPSAGANPNYLKAVPSGAPGVTVNIVQADKLTSQTFTFCTIPQTSVISCTAPLSNADFFPLTVGGPPPVSGYDPSCWCGDSCDPPCDCVNDYSCDCRQRCGAHNDFTYM